MTDSSTLTGEQQLRLSDLAEDVIEYVNSLEQETADLNVYLVGGALRDTLLGETPNDNDFLVVGATTEELLNLGFVNINAVSFGVLHDDNREEWALARTETKPGDDSINTGEQNPADKFGYKAIQTDTKNVPLAADLHRRDITINSTALEITDNTIDTDAFDAVLPDGREFEDTVHNIQTEYGTRRFIDPFNAVRDIRDGRIHPVSDAFTDDPLRALRAARYAARYNTALNGEAFTLTADMQRMMLQVASELNLMSKDRIGEEIVKAMKQADTPSRFWETLKETGVLAVIAPALDRTRIIKPGPDKFHRETSTFTHTMAVLDRMKELCDEQDITGVNKVRRLMMAVGHDLGKVRIADKKGGLWSNDPPERFGHHAQKGVEVVEEFCRRNGIDSHIKCAMRDGAENHMLFHDLPDWSAEDLIMFVDDYTAPDTAEKPYHATIDELLDLAHADHEGRMQALNVFDDDTEYNADVTARWLPDQDDAARPVFDRTAYEKPIRYAKNTIGSIDGYKVMEEELEAALGDNARDVPEETIVEKLNEHDECRAPGEWVGETIFDRQLELFHRQTLYLT